MSTARREPEKGEKAIEHRQNKDGAVKKEENIGEYFCSVGIRWMSGGSFK